jgi:hypothetical protein
MKNIISNKYKTKPTISVMVPQQKVPLYKKEKRAYRPTEKLNENYNRTNIKTRKYM